MIVFSLLHSQPYFPNFNCFAEASKFFGFIFYYGHYNLHLHKLIQHLEIANW